MGYVSWVQLAQKSELTKNTERYYRDRKQGKRECATEGCDTRLSYLTDQDICRRCRDKEIELDAAPYPKRRGSAEDFIHPRESEELLDQATAPPAIQWHYPRHCMRWHDTHFWGRSQGICNECLRQDKSEARILAGPSGRVA